MSKAIPEAVEELINPQCVERPTAKRPLPRTCILSLRARSLVRLHRVPLSLRLLAIVKSGLVRHLSSQVKTLLKDIEQLIGKLNTFCTRAARLLPIVATPTCLGQHVSRTVADSALGPKLTRVCRACVPSPLLQTCARASAMRRTRRVSSCACHVPASSISTRTMPFPRCSRSSL